MLNYTVFQYVSIFLLLPLILWKIEYPRLAKFLLLIAPFVFYAKKLFSGVFGDNNLWGQTTIKEFTSIFPDMAATLIQLKCQYDLSLQPKLSPESLSGQCIFGNVRYGPLFHSLKININLENLDIFYTLIFLLTFCFMIYYYKKEDSVDPLIFAIIFLSPTFNLTMNQLNIDLLLVLFTYFLFIDTDKHFYTKSFLILIFSLIKQHPIGFLIGLVFITNEKNKLIYLYSLIASFFLMNFYFLTNDFNYFTGQPRPSSSLNSTGILSVSENIWINMFNKAIGYRAVLIIYVVLILVLLLLVKKYYLYFNKKIPSKSLNNFQLASITWFLFAGIYANYDYRLIICLLFISFFKNKQLLFLLFILFYLSPFTIFNYTFLNLIQTLTKYFIFLFLFIFLIRSQINNLENNPNKIFRWVFKIFT